MEEKNIINNDKDEKTRGNEKNIYSGLPKHMIMFSEGQEKVSHENGSGGQSDNKEATYGTYKYILQSAYHSNSFKIFLYVIVPIFIIYFWMFRYDDWMGGCHIKMRPSIIEWNNLEIKRSLRYIKNNSKEDYAKVCRYVDVIAPDLPCGGSGGGCFWSGRGKEIQVSTLGHRNNPAITASVIVHETCHSIQNEEKRTPSEDECYKVSYRFLKKIGIADKDIPENWKVE